MFSDGPFRQRLEEEGVRVGVIGAGRKVAGVLRQGGIVTQLRALPGVFDLARKVARKAKDFDVLFANSQKAMAIGALASWFARKPLVWYLHDIVTSAHFSAANRRLCVFLGNRFARRIVANSVASKDAFVEAGGKPSLLSVVYNGLDATAFVRPQSDSDWRALRANLGLSEAPIVAVFSRLAPWKGQHILLEALVHLPGVQALLVGAPLFGDEIRYEAQLRTRAHELSLENRVHFLGFREDVPALLHLADVVVHTSIAPEPFGRVIVEGMLAGKPVVATRAGGACEIIEDKRTGRLVTPGDPMELAVVLGELLADRARTTALTQAGYASAAERFSVRTMVEGIGRAITATIPCSANA